MFLRKILNPWKMENFYIPYTKNFSFLTLFILVFEEDDASSAYLKIWFFPPNIYHLFAGVFLVDAEKVQIMLEKTRDTEKDWCKMYRPSPLTRLTRKKKFLCKNFLFFPKQNNFWNEKIFSPIWKKQQPGTLIWLI